MFQTGPNYDAWRVDENQFPRTGALKDKIAFLIQYAVLAPSAHNTQPWKFRIEDSSITVFLDNSTMLGDSDPTKRQSFESIGACVENLTIAAFYFGLVPVTHYVFQSLNTNAPTAVVQIDFTDSITDRSELARLFPYITQRKSARLDFDRSECDSNVLRELNSLISESELGISGTIIDNNEIISLCSSLGAQGTERAFAMPAFRKELGEWLRHNWTRRSDGMPAFTVGIPDVPSLIVPFMMGRVDTKVMQAKLASKLILSASAVGALASEDTPLGWVKAGQLFERVALYATMRGLTLQVMGALVEFNDIAEKLGHILKLSHRPVLFFRLGKPLKNIPRSPRRIAQEVVM